MSILKVARMGHPILRKLANPVDPIAISSPKIQTLIDDMVETMHEYGGVGLAAPQVHESLQITIIEVNKNSRYPQADDIPLMVLINPVITPLTDEKKLGWEGCLSVPNLRGAVPRFQSIHVEALDRFGNELSFDSHGFLAVVIQHETDHCFGKLFIDRMDGTADLYFLSEWQKYAETLPDYPIFDD